MHHPILVYALVGASIALMLVRPRGVAEVWWIGGGVLLLLVLRLLPARNAQRGGQGRRRLLLPHRRVVRGIA